ncbi:hypothetical protein TTHERM_00295850 (macronuclear) [Tetrahymena thermophila SB210]|uniref:Uncharacterized protein n=1 Tax=Tetrahymena thermophila (strain SB210) TaxID=312017 RepID=I7MIG9_TETTS|nr:hypothetical protein TTHERM_00295850 [Tetrahymena thermophila SB210]EAR92972.2 hypothetical protein TTHERM_00295850 [Tetrahymena thermophila SB210]|eukprot:XP_001013217.2 hypothetical protein TTHERM_00295850 [Tetrahymena thermophila SB210]
MLPTKSKQLIFKKIKNNLSYVAEENCFLNIFHKTKQCVPAEIQLRDQNLYKICKNNVNEDLSNYYEKLNEGNKAQETYENIQFFQGQNNFLVGMAITNLNQLLSIFCVNVSNS